MPRCAVDPFASRVTLPVHKYVVLCVGHRARQLRRIRKKQMVHLYRSMFPTKTNKVSPCRPVGNSLPCPQGGGGGARLAAREGTPSTRHEEKNLPRCHKVGDFPSFCHKLGTAPLATGDSPPQPNVGGLPALATRWRPLLLSPQRGRSAPSPQDRILSFPCCKRGGGGLATR